MAELLIGMNEVGGTGLTLQGADAAESKIQDTERETNGSVTPSWFSATTMRHSLTISAHTPHPRCQTTDRVLS